MSELSVNKKVLTDNSDIHLNDFNPRFHLVHEPVHCPEADNPVLVVAIDGVRVAAWLDIYIDRHWLYGDYLGCCG